MKKNKGKQVFSDNIDDILADKIIEHTEVNSNDNSAKMPERSDCKDEESCGLTKKIITYTLLLITSLVFISMLVVGFKNKSSKRS
jgi:hypothetical protein